VLDLLFHWFISAASLLIVAFLFPGIELRGFGTALIAPIVIGLVNATLGIVFKLFTLPLTILTLGLFWLVINALMLQLAAALVPGFFVAGFWSAFFRRHRAEHSEQHSEPVDLLRLDFVLTSPLPDADRERRAALRSLNKVISIDNRRQKGSPPARCKVPCSSASWAD
jgi:putative membrane protein